MSWRDVPIPDSMQHLPKDKRGFPIPYIVQMDVDGNAHFTINDMGKVMETVKKGLCTISGLPLNRGKWLVGGPLSAFHKHGAYADGPTRYECLKYALQVCPYLAVRNYSGRIDDIKFDYEKNPNVVGLVDTTQMPGRPEVFVAVMAADIRIRIEGQKVYYHPKRPYLNTEFWKQGKQLPDEEGKKLVLENFPEVLPELKPQRIISQKEYDQSQKPYKKPW